MCIGQKWLSAVPSTVRWTAPEVLAHPDTVELDTAMSASTATITTRTEPAVLSPACDVYSFGVVLWELAALAQPFHDVADESQV